MTHDTFETLAAGYALGTLDGEDLAHFRDHLAGGCRQCAAVLRDADEALAAIAAEAPPEIPPAAVKQALTARIAAEQALSAARARLRPRWIPWSLATAAAAGAAAFFTAGVVAARYEATLGQMAREVSAFRERAARDEAALRAEVGLANRVLDLLRDPATRIVRLTGRGLAAGATGRIVWHDKGGGHLLVSNLPPAPAGKIYELWTISGGTPRPAGALQVDQSGVAGQRVERTPDGRPVDVFAVTLEAATGLPAPSGPIVLASR
jgi:hypothetical protein